MLYSLYRMIKYHPWTSPSHHRPHLLALYPVYHIINIILPSAKQKVSGAWVTT